MGATITAEKALRSGDRLINIPSSILLYGGIACGLLSLLFKGPETGRNFLIFAIGGISLSQLYRAVFTLRWQLWAFDHVDDADELYKALLTEERLYDESSWLSFAGRWYKTDKQRWAAIKDQLKYRTVSKDDTSVPVATEIFKSAFLLKIPGVITLVFGVLWGLFMPGGGGWYIIAGGLTLIAINRLIGIYYRSKEPILSISELGISFPSAGLINWDDISDERIELITAGKNRYYELSFRYPGGTMTLKVQNMQIKVRRLNHLLHLYRHRHNSNRGAKARN
jgi:hypothetical protein